jgi:hypothetical protein
LALALFSTATEVAELRLYSGKTNCLHAPAQRTLAFSWAIAAAARQGCTATVFLWKKRYPAYGHSREQGEQALRTGKDLGAWLSGENVRYWT